MSGVDLSAAELSRIINTEGEDDRRGSRGAVSPPIYQSAMFCFPTVAEMRAGLRDELRTAFYTRGNNPTVELLRRKLAALESSEDALAFASGSAAISSAIIAHVAAGDEVVCIDRPYGWTGKLLGKLLPRFGVTARFVAEGSVEAFAAALSERTRMIVVESPNSLTFETQDLVGIAALARERGIVTLCDNSYATPLKQRPIQLGIDLVAHSATKYLNGHSDVVAGILCGSHDAIRRVFDGPFMTLGAALSPHDAWLLLRGLRTLPVRLRHMSESAGRIVERLREDPRIAAVHYPAEDLATGMLSVRLATDGVAGVERFCDALEHFLLTCSWGGYEALAYPMCALSESPNYAADDWPPWNLVRLSVGLEDCDLLLADLEQALEAMAPR
ncbi:MAG: aminotransferase class I/II-fold pyridoxal phosphate-dependent enzyme [Pseudomonadota bacterium]